MNVIVKHIEKTCLKELAFKKLIQKYSKNLRCDVVVVFDLRFVSYGEYYWDRKKKVHDIRISPKKCKHYDQTRLGPVAEKYNLISTFLHEICHATQKEELGSEFYSDRFYTIREITNPSLTSTYSKCETEARAYENKNVHSAVKYYDSCCE